MSDATTLPTGIVASGAAAFGASTASREAGPVQARERIQLLDVLRGFALLGMLQQNDQKAPGPLLSNLIDFLADGSFYTTFSFLFGLGFAIQLLRAEEAKRPFILRYLWRTVILFFIGAGHFIFNRNHPILEVYALFAGVLLLVCRWRPSLILALAAAWLVFSISPRIPEGHVWTRLNPEQVEAERLGTQLSSATAQANPPSWCQMLPGLTDAYRSEVCGRAAGVRKLLTHDVATVQWWKGWTGHMCMFLLGLYAGRRRILRDAAQHTRFLAWVAGVGLVFGLAGNALDVFKEFFAGKGIALPKALDGWSVAYSLGNIGLSLFYLASVTLLFTHRRIARRALAPLAYVGRMGLTNYLMQAIMFVTVLGYRGLDVMSGIEGWYNQLLINSFFIVQILYSRWWFQHFQFGPFEWAWRSLTWFRAQPMRIARAGGEIPAA
jgi:uncharacterized protein